MYPTFISTCVFYSCSLLCLYPTYNCPTGDRFAGTWRTTIPRAGLLMLCLFSFSVLACVTLGFCEIFSNMWWSRARLMLQPYFSVHYGTLPPIWSLINILNQCLRLIVFFKFVSYTNGELNIIESRQLQSTVALLGLTKPLWSLFVTHFPATISKFVHCENEIYLKKME